MPARQLVTIGSLRATPLRRTRARRMGHVDPFRFREAGMGSATAATAGVDLQDAAVALLNYLEANGVPSEHVNDPQVYAYQQKWNADPANVADQLGLDGGYGPLTQGTLNVLTGGIAPLVNTGPPGTVPAVVPPGTITPAGGSSDWTWLLIAAAVAGGAYLLFRKKKKSGGTHHHGSVIEVKTNPRRRRR
jgi:LPXTG-motif cell wall-anchored protein